MDFHDFTFTKKAIIVDNLSEWPFSIKLRTSYIGWTRKNPRFTCLSFLWFFLKNDNIRFKIQILKFLGIPLSLNSALKAEFVHLTSAFVVNSGSIGQNGVSLSLIGSGNLKSDVNFPSRELNKNIK